VLISRISLRKEVSKRSESPTLLKTFPLSLIRTTVLKHGLTLFPQVFLINPKAILVSSSLFLSSYVFLPSCVKKMSIMQDVLFVYHQLFKNILVFCFIYIDMSVALNLSYLPEIYWCLDLEKPSSDLKERL